MKIFKRSEVETKHKDKSIETNRQSKNQVTGEIICTEQEIVQRIKTNLPLGGESWVQNKTPYENAFANGSKILHVISIEPIKEINILKGIKIILGEPLNKTSFSPTLEKEHVDDFENVKIVNSIRRVSSQLAKNLPDGTKIRFDWKRETYETQIDTENGKEYTFNALVRKNCLTRDNKPASINVYQAINARYLDENGWQPLNEFRQHMHDD